jgi:Nuclease-related domain
MRIVTLSNHPGAQLRQERQRRATADDRKHAEFEDARAQHHARVQLARQSRDEARAQHRWLTWLRSVFAVRREQRLAPTPPLPAGTAGAREAALKAGMTGEQQVEAEFERVLGDDWTLLRGYSNRRGEIDHLLLGPQGLIAIEGKHHNGTFHCDGDEWHFDKYDNYGNLVAAGRAICDRGGRSPSVQLNEPASELEGFLRSRGQQVQVRRVVLFTHPKSRLGNCRNLTVRVATSTDYVINLVNGSPPVLDADQLSQLQRLIIRDHEFHRAHRAQRARRK